MANGCLGQNKNSILVIMVMYWLAKFAPNNIEDVTLIYPVTGHSYMPPDCVFGNIEREIKKYPTIVNPKMLLEVIKKFLEILYAPECVTVYNSRGAMSKVVRDVSS